MADLIGTTGGRPSAPRGYSSSEPAWRCAVFGQTEVRPLWFNKLCLIPFTDSTHRLDDRRVAENFNEAHVSGCTDSREPARQRADPRQQINCQRATFRAKCELGTRSRVACIVLAQPRPNQDSLCVASSGTHRYDQPLVISRGWAESRTESSTITTPSSTCWRRIWSWARGRIHDIDRIYYLIVACRQPCGQPNRGQRTYSPDSVPGTGVLKGKKFRQGAHGTNDRLRFRRPWVTLRVGVTVNAKPHAKGAGPEQGTLGWSRWPAVARLRPSSACPDHHHATPGVRAHPAELGRHVRPAAIDLDGLDVPRVHDVVHGGLRNPRVLLV